MAPQAPGTPASEARAKRFAGEASAQGGLKEFLDDNCTIFVGFRPKRDEQPRRRVEAQDFRC